MSLLDTSQILSDRKYAAMNSIDERDLESGTYTTMCFQNSILTLDVFNCDNIHPSAIKIQEPRLFQSVREDSELPEVPLA